jgi:hypothetical protein
VYVQVFVALCAARAAFMLASVGVACGSVGARSSADASRSHVAICARPDPLDRC